MDTETTTPAHTPTPWKISPTHSMHFVSNAPDWNNLTYVGNCDSGNEYRKEIDKANAQLIVTAVNSHDSNVKRIAELEALVARINAATRNADQGRSGCKYGDTEYDSLSVVYGYNSLREEIQLLLSTLSTK